MPSSIDSTTEVPQELVLQLTGKESLADPKFLVQLAERLSPQTQEALLLGSEKDVELENTTNADDLWRIRGYAAELEFGDPPPEPYPTPIHYPMLAQIEASLVETQKFRHLIHVSGVLGLYVPVEFATPFVMSNMILVGSSQRLLAELETVAQRLGHQLVTDDPWVGEKSALRALIWGARSSVTHQLVLSFGDGGY